MNDEYQLTCKVAEMLKAAGLLYTHVPTECPDKMRAIMQARMGVVAGVPDFLIFTPPQLAIELKKPKKGRLSEEQQQWLAELENFGWRVAVCKTPQEVSEVLTEVYGQHLQGGKP
jgi:hypothetical protein